MMTKINFTHLTVLRSCALTVLLLLSCCLAYGQISTKERPYSWEQGKGEIQPKLIPVVNMPNLDMEALKREDLENEPLGVPYRFGFSHDVNLTLSNSGTWKTTRDGGRLWTLRIFSPDALSLNLLYDNFWLPEGAKFFIYSEDMRQHLGAFTSKNNKGEKAEKRGFATGFLFTTSIVLEYYEPAEVDDSGVISIAKIISGYRPADEPDLNCYIEVDCWPDLNIKNAVALMIMGEYACSGALLNNTKNDFTPYFLTANHCFVDETPAEDWMFYWNFETLECGSYYPNFEYFHYPSTTGAELLAKRQETDFMLLKLMEDPAEQEGVKLHYLGWDRTPELSGSVIGIHHPKGYPKMLSLSRTIENYPDYIEWVSTPIDISLPNTHWKVAFHYGHAAGGSSGSPIILAYEKRVVGQLHGGETPCIFVPNIKFYGRFDLSWDGHSANERLKDHLDEDNSDVQFLDGIDGIGGVDCVTDYINDTINGAVTVVGCTHLHVQNVSIHTSDLVLITAGEEISISSNFHAPANSNVLLRIYEPTQSPSQPHSGRTMKYDEPAFKTIDSQNLAIKDIHADDFQLFPNPATHEVTIQGEGIVQVEVYDVTGRKLSFHPLIATSSHQTINVLNLTAGVYLVKIFTVSNQTVTKRLVIAR